MKTVLCSFNESIMAESFFLAINLWNKYERYLQQDMHKVCETITKSLQMSAFMLEFKLFFLSKLVGKMTYKEMEKILHIIEDYFFPTEKKESLLAF